VIDLKQLHRDAPFTDVHAHPSLKAFLWRRNLWRHYWAGKAWDPLSSRCDFRALQKGNVAVLWAAHHLPERELARDCKLLGLLAKVFARRLVTGPPFLRLLEMMDRFERELGRRPDRTELARSVADLGRIRAAGKTAFVHTVEGAHVLEGDVSRMAVLAARGVAMITLTHFYWNEVALQTEGIPSDLAKTCPFRFGEGPVLTGLGRDIIAEAARQRIVVDVTHCSPEARAAVYAEAGTERPIVASHVGLRALMDHPYNLGEADVRAIAATNGAIGVIFMPYWLADGNPRNGLVAIWDTLDGVRQITGSWDHVMIGTDFDGLTDPPDDVRDASMLGEVTRMLVSRGLARDDILKVIGGNAMRVLREGWR
jgi:membrane dipeptidase